MIRSVALGAGLFFMAACAAPARYTTAGSSLMLARDRSTQESGDDVICSLEAPTGSHIRRSVCSTAQELERKRLATQDSMRWLRTRVMSGGGTAVVDDFGMVVTNVNVP
jgi:hypothetical protein